MNKIELGIKERFRGAHLGTGEGQLALVVLQQPLEVDKDALSCLWPQETLQGT